MANPKKTTKTDSTSQVASTATTTPAAPVETKKTTKKVEKVEVASVEAAPVATPATPVATATTTKKSTAKKAVEPKVEAKIEDAPQAETTTEEEKTVVTFTRRNVTKQTVQEDFQGLINKIQEEITKRTQPVEPEATTTEATSASKKSSKKAKETGVPIKFLRTINKRLATLQSDAMKMMKLKQKIVRNNEKSGLMKPVSISSELYKFLNAAGFDDIKNDQNYARVDITRRIHSYIFDNNLRKETDKRVILPDDKLSELLNYNKATATEEMTYFRLPQYLKKHFIS